MNLTCYVFVQLELRRKQFHVLVTAIHDLQQILDGLLAFSTTNTKFANNSNSNVSVSVRNVIYL